MKIYCYALEKDVQPFYESEAKKYDFKLIFINNVLNSKTMNSLPKDCLAVMIDPSSDINQEVLNYLHQLGVKYITTSSAGFDHIDLETATKLGYKIGRIPAYSPTSVASWAFTTGLQLIRNTQKMFFNTQNNNFLVEKDYLTNEFKNLTIGIIGTGKIGFETAKYYNVVGFKVLGYDIFPNKQAKNILKYTDLDTLLNQADLVSLHLPYFKGQNDDFIDFEFIRKMKDGSYLINAARGALVNEAEVLKAIEKNHLAGYAADVFKHEAEILNKKFNKMILSKINPNLSKLLAYYPKVLISPHVAYYTDEAIKNMAQTSMLNFKQLVETNTCDTVIN